LKHLLNCFSSATIMLDLRCTLTKILRRRMPACTRRNVTSIFHSDKTNESAFRACVGSFHHYSTTKLPHKSTSQSDYGLSDRDIDRFTRNSIMQFLPEANSRFAMMEADETIRAAPGLDTKEDSDNSSLIEEEFHGRQIVQRDALSEQSMKEYEMPHKTAQLIDLLANFDPEKPPRLEDFPTREAGLKAIELWLECDALEESVAKYQRVIDEARNRSDFRSISFVEKQVSRWFVPLQEAIEAKKRTFMSKEGKAKDRGRNKFGPLLCSLPSAKLAIIVAHEAIIQCVYIPSYNENESPTSGAKFVKLAFDVGQAVEDEVVVHKLLHKRSIEQAQINKVSAPNGFDENVSSMLGKKEESSVEIPSDSKNSDDAIMKWSYSPTHLKEYLDEIKKYKPSQKRRNVLSYAVQKARQAIEKAENWSAIEKVHLGSALLQILLTTVTIGSDENCEMAFNLELRWSSQMKCVSYLTMNEKLLKMIAVDDIDVLSSTTTRHKPMVVPPKPWTSAKSGGYHIADVDVMRYHGCSTQREAISNTENSVVFDGLNALGRVKWRINKRLLDVAQRCWDENIPLGDIPSRTDFELPEQPMAPSWSGTKLEKGTEEYDAAVSELLNYRDRLAKYNRTKQKNMDLVSLRCSTILKLNQAEKFKDFDEIYFPYNMDFRGRAYPIPPHFSNVGSDLCRGMLQFSESKPLGDRGLFWLKVHLANLAGKDKMTFDGRAKFVDDHLDEVRASVADPFGGERWWMSLENPFQALATCYEIVNAIDSGDPSSYMCPLAVHMDGSCNGLQHYAALGRDYVGGKAVNLCVTDEPQDVYVGVMHEVVRRISEEANRTFDFDTSNVDALTNAQKLALKHNRAAKLVDGLIDRGVVKRTVMTSVYGVTFVGARTQIREKIEQKLAGQGHDLDEIDFEVFNACGYLAIVTLEVIGDLFSGAKCTMNWLTSCARLITQHGYPVAWISPIGLPAVQPYRQKKTARVLTLTQTVTLSIVNDDLPIHKSRQVTAFPPNFIHSLDSSHMLLTALEMDRRGLTFSAVHDSFWTHACDVDEMNGALRDTFVDLYKQPLLERLKETWELRYPELNFPDLPERGSLVLDDVTKAKYFFQ
jgi:DNA-directed RNA polymerase, mitochondrial